MLPSDFQWKPRWQYAHGELALVLDGVHVAYLMRRLDGTWFATLDVHRGINAPLVTRDCRSMESGRAGVETWATRHAARLRQEVGRR